MNDLRDWPDTIIMVACVAVGSEDANPLKGAFVNKCWGCGQDIWVSPNTAITLGEYIKEHDEVEEYREVCNDCTRIRMKIVRDEGENLIEIENPKLPWRYN